MIVTKTVDNYKRQKLLSDLKAQYVERMTEYRKEKHAERVEEKEIRKDNIRNWKHRKEYRKFIQEKMKVYDDHEPITAPAKLEKRLHDRYK